MRVTCHQCRAAYAVDDKLIPPQGVRAQCPRCKHLQVVHSPVPPPTEVAAAPPPMPPPPAASAPGPMFGGAAAASDPFEEEGPVVHCRTCSTPLPDPLDAALGICEQCRAKEIEASATHAPEQATWREVVRTAPVRPSRPTPVAPEPTASAPEPPRPAPPPQQPASAVRSAERMTMAPAQFRSRRSRRPLVLAILLLLVLGGGAVAWIQAGKPTFGLVAEKPKTPTVLPAVERRLAGWQLALVDATGTAQEHFERGMQLFAEDRPTAYLQAEQAFRTAVVLEPTNLRAVTRMVEAFAVGRGETARKEEIDEMRELLDAVRAAAPNLTEARIAYANLLLAIDQVELARAEAESAYQSASPQEKAEALIAWGRTYLRRSAPIARDKFEEALTLKPDLKRAIFYRGLAAEHGGLFAHALADYEERLKLDPNQREALRALARVHASLGDFKAAREALARYASQHPDVAQPRILIVQIAYAVERDLREADRRLKRLNVEYDRFDDQEKVQFLTLWTAVARERGELKLAAEQANGALRINPRYAPAHFQLMLIALAHGDVEAARKHLEACEGELDPARALEYRGRVEAAAGRTSAAVEALLRSAELSPARMAPRLLAAGLLMKAGERDRAYKVMRDALELEPTSIARTRRPVSDYFEAPVDAIRQVGGAFEPDAAGPDAELRKAYEAIVQYHLGNTNLAARRLDAVLATDASSLPALLYRAQIELDRGQHARALAFARRAARVETQSAAAIYLMARALEAQNNRDEAWKAYTQVLALEPNHAGANLRLASFAADANNTAEAKERLLKVVSVEPEQMEARVALFRLGH